MQYAGAEGLIVWVVIVVISMIFRAVKASGGSAAMPPRQRGPQNPRRGQYPRPQVPRQMQVSPYQGASPRRTAPYNEHLQIPPLEHERVRQELQSEFERAFTQLPLEEDVSAPQPVAVSVSPQREESTRQQKRQGVHAERQSHYGVGHTEDNMVVSSGPIRVQMEMSLQRRKRLREAYLLTELIGRPRGYDI